MQIYLVGGAVRDTLLGLPIKERDFVVVGATPELLLNQGYQSVGKDFPVFLHPITKEEYALARTERKSGKGYQGFICYSSPFVTLEEDLKRRDITINAMAMNEQGEIIDPYHGQEDLKNKIIRHVSPAFSEDPLRILRVARFSAYLGDFTIAPETLQLMQQLSTSGELETLSPERLWKELVRAITTKAPFRFFEVLSTCHALPILFPEIKNWAILKKAAKASPDPLIRLATLLSTLEKNQIKTLSQRLSIPKNYQDLSYHAIQHHETYVNAFNLTADALLEFLNKIDAFRRPERFEQTLFVLEIKSGDSTKKEYIEAIFRQVKNVKLTPEETNTLSGKALGQKLNEKRKKEIERFPD